LAELSVVMMVVVMAVNWAAMWDSQKVEHWAERRGYLTADLKASSLVELRVVKKAVCWGSPKAVPMADPMVASLELMKAGRWAEPMETSLAARKAIPKAV
jgi:uncharacterized protein (DUF2126 family)